MTERAAQTYYDIDWGLFGLMVLLLSAGLVMLTSASISVAANSNGYPFFFLLQQLLAVMAGLLLAILMLRTPTEFWQKIYFPLAWLAIALLIAVLIPGVGRSVNGSTRWISLAGMNIQVSEPARLMILIYIAGFSARHGAEMRSSFRNFFRPMFIVALVCGLLLAEPDFGAMTVMLLIAMAVLFIAGPPLRYFLALLIPVVLAVIAVAVSAPYRLARLTGFTNPWADPYGSGFQLTQSLIAIGSGEWFGVGLGNSVQKLFYLPEAHTDFVFAVIAEEFGLVGSIVLIALFGLLVWRALAIARAAAVRDRYFQAYLAFGIAVWQGAQVCINVGVNMGILPTKGLTLPLISYGRSSLIVTLAILALLLRIDLENRGFDRVAGAKQGSRKPLLRRSRT